jgi:hypothetical protein
MAIWPAPLSSLEFEFSVIGRPLLGPRSGGLLPAPVELVAVGPPLFAAAVELGAKYGLEFGEPEWLPDVIGRYGLTPPPRRDS